MYKVMVDGITRDATPEEILEIESRIALPIIPQAVPMRSARLVLLKNGLLSTVQAYFDNLVGEGSAEAKINWEFALTVQRDDPLVKKLIPSLGKTEAEIDKMFIEAYTL